MNNLDLHIVADCGEFSIDEDLMPLVEPGLYTARYVRHETRQFFGSAYKAVFWFQITDFGPAFEVVVPRYYNVNKLVGKAGRGGKFVPGRNSDFMREYCRVFPSRIKRKDRIALAALKDVLVKVRVRTTVKDRRQRSLPEPLKYSVVEEIVGVAK